MITSYAQIWGANQKAARAELMQRVWEKSGGICGLCHEPVEMATMHMDHILPKSRGGPHDIENLQAAHPRCNIRKGPRDHVPPEHPEKKRYPRVKPPRPSFLDEPPMVSIGECARRLNVDRETVRRWLLSGALVGVHPRPGGMWRIPADELQRFLSGAPGGERA